MADTRDKILGFLVLSLGLGFATSHVEAEPTYSKRADVKIKMSDGVDLVADIYIPAGGDNFPTILLRSPYPGFATQWIVEPMTSAGYVVTVQDVRGIHRSGGDFIPFVSERQDGWDTLDWVSTQPWSNGKIGMWGSSYLAHCALAIAPDEHPALKAIVSLSGFHDSQAMTWPGGALHLMTALPWTLSPQIQGSRKRIDWADAFKRLPVFDIPESLGINSPAWKGAVRVYRDEQVAATGRAVERLDRIKIPIFHLTGWNDFIGRHALDAYEGITSAPRVRKNS